MLARGAVVWYHEEREAQGGHDKDHAAHADPLAWHAGCVVRAGGGERWALQKFKEHPFEATRPPASPSRSHPSGKLGDRAPRSFYEVFEAHREALEPPVVGVDGGGIRKEEL